VAEGLNNLPRAAQEHSGTAVPVTTAVDGADALTQVRSGEFDLVVSDVDMRARTAFELTAKNPRGQKIWRNAGIWSPRSNRATTRSAA